MPDLSQTNITSSLVSTKIASEISGYNSDYLGRVCREGKIKGVQVGRAWLIDKESLEQFVEAQQERKRELAQQISKVREKEYKTAHKTAHKTTQKAARAVISPIQRSHFADAARGFRGSRAGHSSRVTRVNRPLAAAAVALIFTAGTAYASTSPYVQEMLARMPETVQHVADVVTRPRTINDSFRITDAAPAQKTFAVPFNVPDAKNISREFAFATGAKANTYSQTFAAHFSTEENARVAHARIAVLTDAVAHPSHVVSAFMHGYVQTGADIFATAQSVGDAYLATVGGVADTSLATASSIRDVVANAPTNTNALLALYERGAYAWVDSSHTVAQVSVGTVYNTGGTLGALATAAPSAIVNAREALANAWVDRSLALANSAADTQTAAGTKVLAVTDSIGSRYMGAVNTSGTAVGTVLASAYSALPSGSAVPAVPTEVSASAQQAVASAQNAAQILADSLPALPQHVSFSNISDITQDTMLGMAGKLMAWAESNTQGARGTHDAALATTQTNSVAQNLTASVISFAPISWQRTIQRLFIASGEIAQALVHASVRAIADTFSLPGAFSPELAVVPFGPTQSISLPQPTNLGGVHNVATSNSSSGSYTGPAGPATYVQNIINNFSKDTFGTSFNDAVLAIVTPYVQKSVDNAIGSVRGGGGTVVVSGGGDVTSANAHLTNVTISGGTATLGSADIGTLTTGSSTIGSLTTTGTTTLATTTVNGDLTVTGTITAGSLAVTSITSNGPVVTSYFTATSTTATSTFPNFAATNGVINNATSTNLFSALGSFTNAIFGSLTATLANITTATIANLTGTNSQFVNSTTTNAVATNSTTTNSVATNATTTNLHATSGTIDNATSTNIYAVNGSINTAIFQNATSTNFFSALGSFTNALFGSLTATLADITTATIANLTGTNSQFVNSTTTNARTTNLFATNATTTNFAATNGVISNATSTNSFATNLGATNLSASNALFGNATSTNFFSVLGSFTNAVFGSIVSNLANITTATITNLTGTNSQFVNSTTTNATTTNLFATNATTTNFAATNAVVTNGTITNLTGTTAQLGNATTTNFAVTGFVESNLVPAINNQYNLGSAGATWSNGYFDSIHVNNFFVASTSIDGTASNVFNINSGNATADTQDSTLVFNRGTVAPNATLTWNSTLKRFDFNQPVQTPALSTASFTLGSSTFSSLLGSGLANVGGALTVTTSTSTLALDTQYFKNGGNSFGGTATLGTKDNNPLNILTNNSVVGTFLANGFLGLGSTTPAERLSVTGNALVTGSLKAASLITTGNTNVGSLTIGSLSGFLKATAGAVTTALVDLSTDVSSTLPVANGGTGANTLTGLLVGNGTGAFTATTLSSGIASQISDETGTGALVFAGSPTFTGTAVFNNLTAASATSTNAAITNATLTNLTVGGSTFTSLLGSGLANVGGALTVTVSTTTLALDTTYFKNGGNSFGAAAQLGTNDNTDLIFKTNTLERIRVNTSGQLVSNIASAANTPAFTWAGDLTTGIFHPATNTVGISTGGVERARIDSNGFLGIGTTTASKTLTVAGDVQVTGRYFDSSASAGTAGQLLSSTGTGTAFVSTSTLGLQTSGNYITALTGDITATGPGSAAATLSTVNGNVGSFGSSTAIPTFTINGKGLITAASTVAVIAPAGTLTGTTLASNVVNSSLTSVGTLSVLTVSGATNLSTLAVTSATSTNATITNLTLGGSTFTSLLGSGLANIGGVLTATTSTSTLALDSQYFKQNGNAFSGLASLGTTDSNALRFITGGTERGRFDTSGNFNATGSITAGSQFVGLGGTGAANTPAYTFASDLTTGIFHPANNTIGFTTGGIQRAVIDGSGNLGLGTTTPFARLTVVGDFSLSGGGLYDANFTRGTVGQLLQTTGTGVQWVSTSTLGLGTGTIGTSTALVNGQVAFSTGPNTIGNDSGFVWDNTLKRLGLGQSGAVPSAILDVHSATNTVATIQANNTGAQGLSGGAIYQLLADPGTAILSGSRLGAIRFAGAVDALSNFQSGSAIESFATENWSGTSAGTKLAFSVTPNGTQSRAVALTINQDGNVGIGTTTPFAKLTVVGDLSLSGGGIYDRNATRGTIGQVLQTTGTGVQWVSTSTLGFASSTNVGSANQVAYYNSSGVLGGTAGFTFDGTNLSVGGTITATGQHIGIGGTGAANTPAFTWSGDLTTGIYHPATNVVALTTGGVERARIDGNGFLGIGTTTAPRTLTVAGDVQVTGRYFDSSASAGTAGQLLSSTGTGTAFMSTSTLGLQPAGNYITALTGDITATGPGSAVTTLATVNGNVGSFGSSTAIPTFTVNAKGLITAAGSVAVIAPAGTLTGTTLASNVVNSSLTNVGILSSLTVSGATNLATLTATNATTTNFFATNISSTNITVGTSTFTTLLGGGLSNIGGALTVTTSTSTLALDSQYFKQNGNAFSGLASLGTTDSNALRFITGGTERGRFDTSGNFNATGSITAGTQFVGVGGTGVANTPAFTFGGDLTTGVYHPAANQIGFSTGGIFRAIIDGNGFLGIGTTTPSRTLTVAGDLGLTGTLYAGNTSAGTLGQILQTTGTSVQWVSTSTLGLQTSGNYITALTGDVTAAGPGSAAATLATVNSNTGSFGSSTAIPTFTVNGKGLITAAGTVAVIAPAGTLTGTTLASNVVTSSLTSIGTLTALTVSGNTALTNATSTNLGVTNLTLGGSTFTSLLGSGLANIGGVLTATTSTSTLALDSQYFKQNGNAFSGLASLGTTDSNALRFITGGTERGRFDTSGNFGIGTTTPFAKLTVVGDLSLSGGGLYDANATRGTIGQLLQTTGTGVQWVSTSTLGFASSTSVGSANRVAYYNSSGVLGGTSGFTFDGTNLSVGGTITATGQHIGIGGTGAANTPAYTFASDLTTGIFHPANNQIGFSTGGIQRAVIDGSGNFGIGSTSPYARLSIAGVGTGTGFNFQTTDSANNPLFSILDNGNIGIGTTTPGAHFALAGGNFIHSAGSTPVVTSSISLSGVSNGIGTYVVGRYAYVVDGGSGFKLDVIDISNPSLPVVIGSVADILSLNGAFTVKVSGNYAYVTATGSNKFVVIDISNPSTPFIAGTLSNALFSSARGLYISGKYAYVLGNGSNALSIIDISNPTTPVIIGSVTDATNLNGADSVFVSGKYAYATSALGNKFNIIDVSNPTAPVIVATLTDASNLGNAKEVYVSGRYAYVLGQGSNALNVIDVSSTTAPTLVGTVHDSTKLGAVKNMFVAGHYAYVTANSGNRFTTVDISNPAAPTIVSSLLDATNLNNPRGVFVSGKYAYVAAGSKFTVLDINGIDVPSANLGAANTESLAVLGNSDFGGDLFVHNGLSVGSAGIYSGGSLSVLGTLGENPFMVASSSGTNLLTLNKFGNLGLGTTTPFAKLTVVGDLSLSGGIYDNNATLGTAGQILQSTGTGIQWVSTSTLGISGGASVTGSSSQVGYFNGANSLIGSSTLVFNGTNLGIGSSTPLYNLSVAGNAYIGQPGLSASSLGTTFNTFTTDLNSNIIANSIQIAGSLNAAGISQGLAVILSDTGSNNGSSIMGINAIAQKSGGGTIGTITGLQVSPRASGSVTTITAMNGVVSQPRFNGASSNIATLINFSAAAATTGGTVTSAYGFKAASQKVAGVTTGYGFASDGTTDLNYFLGSTGIGTTSPSAKVDVYGAAGTSDIFAISSSSNSRLLTFTSSGNLGIGTSTPSAQLHTTGTVRFSNFGAGTLQTDASGNLTVSSDERLKNVNGSFERGLADLQKLSPILYHWNAVSGLDQSTQYAGFSAQNVQSAIPEAVTTDGRGFLALQDRPILAASVNAIKELAGQTGVLATTTESLAGRLASVEAANAQAQAAVASAQQSAALPHALTATEISAQSLAIAQGVSAGSLTTHSVNADGTVSAARYVVPATARVFTAASTTMAAVLPAEALTEDGVNVDLYKLASYAVASVQSLGARTDLLATRIDDIETRLGALESAATATSSVSQDAQGVVGLAAASIQHIFESFGIFIRDGIAQFTTLVTHQLVFSSDTNGTSSAASVVIPAGQTEFKVTNTLILPTSKIFITFTSSVNGAWYISKKEAGSFTVSLASAQATEVTFDYFLVQTEGQIAAVAAPLGTTPPATTPAPTDGSTPAPVPTPVSQDGGPTVSLNGQAAVQIPQGAIWTDPGATAHAADGTDLTAGIAVSGGVDTNTAGLYTVTYRATDAAGKFGEASRIVTIIGAPTSAPTPAAGTPAVTAAPSTPTVPAAATPTPTVTTAPADPAPAPSAVVPDQTPAS